MNKAELIEEIAKQTGYAKKQVNDIVEYLLKITIEQLQNKQDVHLTGFGTFSAKFRHARMGVNPQKPSERIQIPAVVVPKFKAGKTLKDALKNTHTVDAPSDETNPPNIMSTDSSTEL